MNTLSRNIHASKFAQKCLRDSGLSISGFHCYATPKSIDTEQWLHIQHTDGCCVALTLRAVVKLTNHVQNCYNSSIKKNILNPNIFWELCEEYNNLHSSQGEKIKWVSL